MKDSILQESNARARKNRIILSSDRQKEQYSYLASPAEGDLVALHALQNARHAIKLKQQL